MSLAIEEAAYVSSNNHIPLYEKYRPNSLDQLIGSQAKSNAEMLSNMLKDGKLPHAIMFVGDSGTGKTTCARILANLVASEPNDIHEFNMSNHTGIDFIRDEIEPNYIMTGWGGGKVYIMDEAHNMSKNAQDAFLKVTEGIPSHCYFFIATDSPDKIDVALKGRFQEFCFSKPTSKELGKLLYEIAGKEGKPISAPNCMLLADKSANIRKAINNLEQILNLDEITDQKINELISDEIKETDEFFPILKMLLWSKMPPPPAAWGALAPLLKTELAKKQPVVMASAIATTCRGRLLNVKYKSPEELIKLQKVLRLFSRDFANLNGQNMIVSTFFEAITIIYQDQLKAK